MHKESSLITVSNSVRKLIIVFIIIAILAICWNSFKNIPQRNDIIPPIASEYKYLTAKKLAEDFEPEALKSLNEISLYSKEILLDNQLPDFPKYIYVYKAESLKEDFGTFANANSIAAKFGFQEQNQKFEGNQITWNKGSDNLFFNRSDLSVSYSSGGGNKMDLISANNLTTFLNSFGFDLSKFDLTTSTKFKSTRGDILKFDRYLSYMALDDNSIAEFLEENKVPTKAKYIETRNENNQLYVELKDINNFKPEEVLSLFFMPLNINNNSEDAGIYEIIPVDMAFQEINTYKVQTNQEEPQSLISGSLFNITLINNDNYTQPLDHNQIKSFTVNAQKTTLGYVLAQSDSIAYLHPVYIFTGQGNTNNNQYYTFYIYIDALPKNEK
jgi:hypothetical protein